MKGHAVVSPRGRAEVLEVAVANATALEEGVEVVLRRVNEEGENITLGAGVAVQQGLGTVQLDALDGVVGAGVVIGLQVQREGRQADVQAGDVEGQTARTWKCCEVHHLLFLCSNHEGIVVIVTSHARGEGVVNGRAFHLEGGGRRITSGLEAGFERIITRVNGASEAVEEKKLTKRGGEDSHHMGFDGEL